MQLIQTIREVNFALQGITAEGRVYYAHLPSEVADYATAFELAAERLEAQAKADTSVKGFVFPMEELAKRDRRRLDHLFACLRSQQIKRAYHEDRLGAAIAA